MTIHFSYHFSAGQGTWGFGDFILTGDDVHPPRDDRDLRRLRERVKELEKVDSIVIIAWNVM